MRPCVFTKSPSGTASGTASHPAGFRLYAPPLCQLADTLFLLLRSLSHAARALVLEREIGSFLFRISSSLRPAPGCRRCRPLCRALAALAASGHAGSDSRYGSRYGSKRRCCGRFCRRCFGRCSQMRGIIRSRSRRGSTSRRRRRSVRLKPSGGGRSAPAAPALAPPPPARVRTYSAPARTCTVHCASRGRRSLSHRHGRIPSLYELWRRH